jgi:hypothetical protein
MCIARTQKGSKCKRSPGDTYCYIHKPKSKSKTKTSKSKCTFKISPTLRKSIFLRNGYYYWKNDGRRVGKYVNGDGKTLFPHPAVCR